MNLEKVKNIFFKYFKVWWIPIVSYLIPFIVFLLGEFLKSDSIIDISLLLFFVNLLGNIISAIVQIIIKKWYFLIPQILISGFLFVFVSIIFTFSPPDYYGANKEIPKDIEIYEPMETEPTEKDFGKFDLVLASSFQPGIYNYFTNYKPTETGNFYIKAFEVTSNDHIEFLNEQYELGHLLASGRKIPRTGGIILSNIKSKSELEKIIEKDPFKKNEIADYELTEFIPSKTCEELKFLME